MPEALAVGTLKMLAERPTRATRSPVLFVHGFLATGHVFERYLSFFAARGHPAYALHLRGRAGSGGEIDVGRASVEDFVADASLAAREIGRPIVVGHSLGGLVAQKLVERDEVAAAVLLSPAPPRGIPLLTRRLIVAMTPYLFTMLRSRPFVARWKDVRRLVLTRIPDAEQRALIDQFVPDSGRAARELALGTVAVDRARVRSPMLVVGGDADRFIPLSVARRVAKRYGAPLHVAHDHAHLLPLEPGWETTATFIADWIASQAPTRTPNPEVIA